MTSLTTTARQLMTRSLYPSVLRRRIAALRACAAKLLADVDRAALQSLIQMTKEDIERINAEAAALPWERLDHERELARLQQRLADLSR